MKAKLKLTLLSLLAILLGGSIYISVGMIPFVGLLGLIKEPVFLLSMFASVGLEIATILSIGPARRKLQEEKTAARLKKEELPEPPCDLNDPDIAVAIDELNEMLPGNPLKLDEWKAEFVSPEVRKLSAVKAAASNMVENYLSMPAIDRVRAPNPLGAGGGGGSSSYAVSYKGVQIERPSAPSANTTEAEFRRYAEQLGFDFVGWTREDNMMTQTAQYMFNLRNPISGRYHRLGVRICQPPMDDRLEMMPAAFLNAYKRALDQLADVERKKLAQTLMVPEGLLSVAQTSAGEVQYRIDMEKLKEQKDVPVVFGEYMGHPLCNPPPERKRPAAKKPY